MVEEFDLAQLLKLVANPPKVSDMGRIGLGGLGVPASTALSYALSLSAAKKDKHIFRRILRSN